MIMSDEQLRHSRRRRRPRSRSPAANKTFPVRRIWCVGRNYLEHIREMGQDEREPPFFFAKPADAIVPDGATVPYPSLTKDLHHEVELVVALKSGGRNIDVKALDCIYGYGVGIDLTRRDLQIASRDIKRPWEIGKAFDASAPCGPLEPASRDRPSGQGPIALKCNGKVRQDGDLAQMIWNVPEVISKLSEMVELAAGDIIMTGTPVGRGRDGRGRQARMRGRGRRNAHGDDGPADHMRSRTARAARLSATCEQLPMRLDLPRPCLFSLGIISWLPTLG